MWLLLIMIVIVSGCVQQDDYERQREHKLSDSRGDIIVGVSWPFADMDDGFSEGLELALDEIHATGGSGRLVKLIIEDEQTSVATGMTIAQSYAENPEMVAVIGHRSSSIALPVASIYQNAGLLYLSPSATSHKLAASKLSRYISLIPNDRQEGERLVEYAASAGYKKIVIFYSKDEYGKGLADSFEDAAKAHGMQIVDRVSDYEDPKRLRHYDEKWKLLGYDAVLLAEMMPNAAQFLASFRADGIQVPIIGGKGIDSLKLLQEAGHAAEGAVVVSIFDPDRGDEAVQSFMNKFKRKYGHEPSTWAVQAYDSLTLLVSAIEKAGSRRPDDIAAVLKQSKLWPGVAGPRSFDAYGVVYDMPIMLKQVKDGQFNDLK
ncbi:ABC transporter substrate-binding protein [Cohnella panacarvi]|uniref:ABC transporter substrate-binding protein n=1 Tax=Cohnella panacarvi TaxID=400776 RepID=UPI00047D6D73|nr:ABC transporter substrate-binding protein [Cohnella panacarvi]